MEPIKKVEIERVFNAQPEIIWKAWTYPEMLKKWWGPNEVSIPECEVNLREGGKFYIVMEAGEGMGEYKGIRWPMLAQYTTVEPQSKLGYSAKAWTEGDEENTNIEQTTEITFTKEKNGTKIKIIASIFKMGPKAGMAAEGMEYGFNQQLDKLEKYLSN